MIELKQVSFLYGQRPVLHEMNMVFESGKLYGIIGPNGCGKTTLVRLLSRMIEPESGEILLDHKPYRQYNRKEFARRIALLPQGRSVPYMTVEDLVSGGRFPYMDLSRRLTPKDRDLVKQAMIQAHVLHNAGRNMAELSGGERQRAYIAMLLAQNTDVVLLDEPTTYLDIANQFSVLSLLQSMRENGKCVIAVLHELSAAMRYCDELVVMQSGRICACGAPEIVASSGVLENVFHVRCRKLTIDGKTEYLFCP